MKYFLLVTIIVVQVFSVSAQKKWQKEGIKVDPPICYGSGETHHSFVDAPQAFLKRLKSTQQKSTIIVDYINFEEEPKIAFQYAVDIWEHLIASPVPIYLTAKWMTLGENVLGSCGPYLFFENFDSAPYVDHYYPVALVEKLEGEEVTDESIPDMLASFNSDNDSWYFGTDGNPPAGKYDFVSVVLHEIGHGLGFTGFFYEEDGFGFYGDPFSFAYPGIFDEFVINSSNQQLVDTSLFSNPSEELYSQFRSQDLYYKSETAKSKNETDTYPRLYAPFTFDEGSSIYHFNEGTYKTGDTNSLMTPYFDEAEAIHDPGPLMLGIFADMGWDYTSIIHIPLDDMEQVGEIQVKAEVETDTEIDSTSVAMILSSDSFANSDTLTLNYSSDESLFSFSLNSLEEGVYQYYLAVQDTSGRTYYLPGAAPADVFEFTIGADLKAPEVTHVPITSMLEGNLTSEVLVEATDNIGISTVVMQYIVNDGEPQTLTLDAKDDNFYQNIIELEGLVDGDSVQYQIVVTDSSENANQTILPEVGEFYTFYIDGLYDAVDKYSTDFNEDDRDFISSDFYIGVEDFFDDGALHSPHPYSSPNEDNAYYNFSALLKYPIIIDDEGKMSFREVVLVEPGDTGSEYGDDNFWDYVIVEGSKNGTNNWLPLTDGYDSNENVIWKINYNNSIQGGNSAAVGKKSYFIKHELTLTESGNFQEGDTIYIRFRLYSDPYAHGWGWVIDDLHIQDPATGIDDLAYSPGEVLVYPNPVENDLYVKGSFKLKVGQLKIAIFNGYGQLIKREELDVKSTNLMYVVNVQSLRAGLYLVAFEFENGQVVTRKFVKQ